MRAGRQGFGGGRAKDKVPGFRRHWRQRRAGPTLLEATRGPSRTLLGGTRVGDGGFIGTGFKFPLCRWFWLSGVLLLPFDLESWSRCGFYGIWMRGGVERSEKGGIFRGFGLLFSMLGAD